MSKSILENDEKESDFSVKRILGWCSCTESEEQSGEGEKTLISAGPSGSCGVCPVAADGTMVRLDGLPWLRSLDGPLWR